ncbi:MAG: hypothetical protein EOO27_38820, partial [Comamonadaceae bacterium]
MHEHFATTPFDDPQQFPPRGSSSPISACPACKSQRTICRDTGKKAGAAIGTIAGAAGGISAALAGATTGAGLGIVIG